MAFKTRDQLMDHVYEKDTVWWEIYDKTNKNLLDKSGTEALDPTVCCGKLKNFLESQGDDWFIINYKSNIAPSVKTFTNTFRNSTRNSFTDNENFINNNNNNNSMSTVDIEKRIEEGIEKYIEKMRIQALEKENAELKKALKDAEPNPADKVIGRIGEVLLPVLNNYVEQNPALLGTGKMKPTNQTQKKEMATTTENVDEMQQKEQLLAEKTELLFNKIDNSGFDVVEVVTKLSDIEPEKLSMLLKML